MKKMRISRPIVRLSSEGQPKGCPDSQVTPLAEAIRIADASDVEHPMRPDLIDDYHRRQLDHEAAGRWELANQTNSWLMGALMSLEDIGDEKWHPWRSEFLDRARQALAKQPRRLQRIERTCSLF